LGTEDGMKNPCAVSLHNVLTVAKQDLGRRIASLSEARMEQICAALQFALGCRVSR
jgi:mRNA-degrading endonuclease toxin of MazEF toxin-antitoxin module